MIKRTIEISSKPAHLTVKRRQLVLKRGIETIVSFPCEDVGVVLVDHPGATYSLAALSSLVDSDATLVVCGRDHLPCGILLPLSDHSQIVWRLHEQISASKPLRKQLWKQLVQAKIRGQAFNIPGDYPAHRKLLDMACHVRSGDPQNIEAQAARVYWSNYLPDEVFRRDRNADGLNSLLNYGYAVIRAAVARALVAAGLMPAIGLHHSNRSNSFCLADDMMEPLRSLVDDRARELFRAGCDNLDKEAKAGLLKLISDRKSFDAEHVPLMVNLHRMTASLVRCYQGLAKTLEIPKAISPTASDSLASDPVP